MPTKETAGAAKSATGRTAPLLRESFPGQAYPMQFPTRNILAALAGFSTQMASAQTAPEAPMVLEPVRVTADLWASLLERIPASVSVFTETALQAGAVRHFGDLADQIPNLTWTGGTARPRYFQIRGIGENSQFEGETPDSAVRFVVDDFDFTGLGTVGSTFDVHQVEVLRGPQAGAFGANAAGGVVRLMTNAPTPFWTGRVEAAIGGDGLHSGGFALGGPLVADHPEQLMIRLAVQQNNSDGFRQNVTLNRATNARDELTARLRLTWNPNVLWRWDAAILAANFNNGFDEFALDNNGRLTYSDQPGRDEQRSLAGSLRGAYLGWDGVRLTTITSGTRTRSRYSYDSDWTAASYAGFNNLNRTRKVVNQELRLDSEPGRDTASGINRWTLGAFFSGVDEFSAYAYEDPYGISSLKTDYRATNTAIFGQFGHDFTPRARLVVGLRVEQINLSGSGTLSDYDKGSATFAPSALIKPRFSDYLVGGKVSVERDLGDHELAFVSMTRGYKAGGINIDARIDPVTDPLTYGTEILWNYEAGLRGHWLDRRVTGEVTLFFLQRRDTQVRDSAGFGGNYRFFTGTGASSHLSGLEASGAYALSREWSVHGSLALMQSALDPFVLVNGNSGGGRELANTPRYGYTLGTRYGADRGFFAAADLIARAQQFDSNSQNEARRAFQVVNASLGYAWREWTVTLWAKNLLDEYYEKRVYFFGNEEPDYAETRYEDRADPRQIGGSVAYRF